MTHPRLARARFGVVVTAGRFVVMSHGRKAMDIDKADTTLREPADHVIKR